MTDDPTDAALATIKSEHDDLEAQLAAAQADDAADAQQILQLEEQVAQLKAQLAQAQQPAPAPTPATGTTAYGSTPVNGGTSLAAALTVASKWGDGVPNRMFNSAGTLLVQNDSRIGRNHTSAKPNLPRLVAGNESTLAPLRTGIKAARAGDVLEVWHEPKVKLNQGTAPQGVTIDDFVAAKNAFYDLVKSINPNVLVACTDSIARWTGSEDLSWMDEIRCDLIGADLDGDTNTTRYPDWTKALVKVAKYAAAHPTAKGRHAWPEFGHMRLASDPTGSGRAAFINKHAAAAAALPAQGLQAPMYVCYYEYPLRATNPLTAADEVAAYKALVAKNPVA